MKYYIGFVKSPEKVRKSDIYRENNQEKKKRVNAKN